jgi:hypothetical protein
MSINNPNSLYPLPTLPCKDCICAPTCYALYKKFKDDYNNQQHKSMHYYNTLQFDFILKLTRKCDYIMTYLCTPDYKNLRALTVRLLRHFD